MPLCIHTLKALISPTLEKPVWLSVEWTSWLVRTTDRKCSLLTPSGTPLSFPQRVADSQTQFWFQGPCGKRTKKEFGWPRTLVWLAKILERKDSYCAKACGLPPREAASSDVVLTADLLLKTTLASCHFLLRMCSRYYWTGFLVAHILAMEHTEHKNSQFVFSRWPRSFSMPNGY